MEETFAEYATRSNTTINVTDRFAGFRNKLPYRRLEAGLCQLSG